MTARTNRIPVIINNAVRKEKSETKKFYTLLMVPTYSRRAMLKINY